MSKLKKSVKLVYLLRIALKCTQYDPLLCCPGSGWVVGRLREGQHEHAQLNGWLSAAAARRRCEADPSCGGFTYKGFLPSQAQAYAKLLFSLFKAHTKIFLGECANY